MGERGRVPFRVPWARMSPAADARAAACGLSGWTEPMREIDGAHACAGGLPATRTPHRGAAGRSLSSSPSPHRRVRPMSLIPSREPMRTLVKSARSAAALASAALERALGGLPSRLVEAAARAKSKRR